ncbi:cilia- and flagella-associated protein [Raphidocelis subcapitata]|uniref:Cilia-and flagella-associated protein n=1 Tax=Raphidocelis subcapitata TaxID=307507 RepID=A0A2V0NQL9_9CHLO|nr:cilia- and flagella-associated protein [Raphidocelis subcapitata]|eukprot:GBF89931.1 cilia- and flagella-associated protein [Raphidocelis subcapitata]
MAAAAASGLAPRLVFGLRVPSGPGGGDCLQYAEDGGFIYAAGAAAVICAPDGRSQRFLPGGPDCECVTALAVAPNRRLLAVAERSEKGVISVYDLQTLKRRKALLAAEVGSQEYVSLSFSPDGKQLLAQGGGPEWNLLLFAWERAKVTACIRATNNLGAPLCKCALSPGDGGLATALGPGVLRIFRVSESGLKALPLGNAKRESLPFTSQAWLPVGGGAGGGAAGGGESGGGAGADVGGARDKERQLLGTSDGEILLLEGTELKATFSCETGGRSVEALAAYRRGFAAGQDGGLVTLFERDERDAAGFRRARTLTVHNHPHKVRFLAVSPGEEQLALALEGGPAFALALANQELMKPEEMNFEPLGPGVHTEGVTGLDTCVRRPLVATCSTDRHVRLWNYIDRTCELDKAFTEEAHAIALHPSGSLLLVGFSDRLRLMAVLLDDLRTVKEFAIRGCREVCFAHGGHLFAAANGAAVGVFSTYTSENIGNLRGHNSKVRGLCWSADDSRLLTAGADGAVYEWRLSDLKREKENVLKGCIYSAVASTADNKSLLAAGSDGRIRELEDSAGAGTVVAREVDAGSPVTALAVPFGGRVVFAGTESGALRGYRLPLNGEYYEVKLHAGPVTRLVVSWDDGTLLSAGGDGAVALLDIRDRELARASSRKDLERLPWAEEVLVSKAELDERRARVSELEQQVSELTMSTEYQLRLKDLHAAERLKEVTDRAAAAAEAERQKYEALLAEKNEQELEYEERLRGAEARAAAQLAALDAQYQSKLMAEVERYSTLLQEKEALNERWDEQNGLLVESHERVVAELTEEYEAKLAEEALAREAARRERDELEKEFAEVKRQVEEDADRELEDARARAEARLAAERETSLRLKGENGIMRKKFQGLARDLDEQREALAAQQAAQRELYATIRGLERDIEGLKREIRERDDAIGDKERRIHELKRKNQELEKFKFVLDYKIKELKRQIEPREAEIGKMRQIVSAMDAELERYHRSNSGLDLAIQSLRQKESGLQSEVLAQRGSKAEVASRLDRVVRDISELSAVIQDPKALKDKAKWLYQRHCGGAAPPEAPDDAVASEHARQRQYLERTVDGLKRKLAADAEAHRLEGLHVMGQNAALIREINELRREIKALKSGGGAAGARGAGARGGSLASLSSSYTAAGRSSGAAASGGVAAASKPRGRAGSSAGGGGVPASPGGGGADASGLAREVEAQRALVESLRSKLEARDGVVRSLAAAAASASKQAVAVAAAPPGGGGPPLQQQGAPAASGDDAGGGGFGALSGLGAAAAEGGGGSDGVGGAFPEGGVPAGSEGLEAQPAAVEAV